MRIGNYGELWGNELCRCAIRTHPWELGIMGNYGEMSCVALRPARTHGNWELWGNELYGSVSHPRTPWELGIMGNYEEISFLALCHPLWRGGFALKKGGTIYPYMVFHVRRITCKSS